MADGIEFEDWCKAFARDDADAMGKFLKSGFDPRKPMDYCGFPAMHWAAACNAVKIMEKLVEHGIECDTLANEHCVTPLSVATTNHATKAVLFLLEQGVSPNTADIFGHSAIHSAIIDSRDKEMAMMLLEAGASMSYPLYNNSQVEN